MRVKDIYQDILVYSNIHDQTHTFTHMDINIVYTIDAILKRKIQWAVWFVSFLFLFYLRVFVVQILLRDKQWKHKKKLALFLTHDALNLVT